MYKKISKFSLASINERIKLCTLVQIPSRKCGLRNNKTTSTLKVLTLGNVNSAIAMATGAQSLTFGIQAE
jgi:hypothetical protein